MIIQHVLDAVREEVVRRDIARTNDPLYHVTYYGRLPNIAHEGLRASRPRAIDGMSYDSHTRGRIFLTEPEGVDFWVNRAEVHAEANSDDVLEDGLVPVVLRVSPDCFDSAELVEDPLGSSDVGDEVARAWMIEGGATGTHGRREDPEPFGPECLEVYDGEGWAPVGDYDTVNPALAIDAQPNPDFDPETDEHEFLHYFKSPSPLRPDFEDER